MILRIQSSIQLILLLLVLLQQHYNLVQAQDRFRIGTLSTLQHEVSGTLYAIDSRTLQIEGLTYDGTGPAGVFWVDTVAQATGQGRIIPFKETCETDNRLPRYTGETVTLELPEDLTLSDIRYFSVWCRAVSVEFGGVEIPADFATSNSVPTLAVASCASGEGEGMMSSSFPVQEGWNCEPLSEELQARWRVNRDADEIDVELVAVIKDGEYAGFGPSGEDTFTKMVGSDVVIGGVVDSANNEFDIVDYSMTSRSQCSAGVGVCADTKLAGTPGVDSITNTMGNYSNGVAQFKYTRPLKAAEDIDRDINLEGESFITWAVGPYDQEPNFHQGATRYPQPGDDGMVKVMVEWGREANNACPRVVGNTDDDEKEEIDQPGFLRPTISNTTEIIARIGPSGFQRGVEAITGGTAWGIAWYLTDAKSNDSIGTLIPTLAVERGKTYNFKVYGGIGREANVIHPFYITESAEGGYLERNPLERLNETVYAGITPTVSNSSGVFEFDATAQGSLCELKSSILDTNNVTWDQFKASIDDSCSQDQSITNNPGNLTWTVAEDTPDLVYYQCVTHRFLGFKIAVFNEGEVDLDRLKDLNNGGALIKDKEDKEDEDDEKKCIVKINTQGDEVTFNRCELDEFSPLELYYSINETDDSIDTAFRIPITDDLGYVAFGWGYERMLDPADNTHVVMGLLGDENIVTTYSLTSRTAAGVRPSTDNLLPEITDKQIYNDSEFITVRFKRPLTSNNVALRNITVSGNVDTPFIWATGARSLNSDTQVRQHGNGNANRANAKINLQTGSSSSSDISLPRLRAHAILMSIAWGLFVPWAILVMRFGKKWNPISFNVHRGINTTAVLFTIAALLLAIFSAQRNGSSDNHRFIGYAVSALAIVQLVGGIARPHDKTSQVRKIWYAAHAFAGSSTLILAVVNIFLGIGLGFFGGQTVWRILIIVSVAMVAVLAVILSFMPSQFPTKEEVSNAGGKVIDDDGPVLPE